MSTPDSSPLSLPSLHEAEARITLYQFIHTNTRVTISIFFEEEHTVIQNRGIYSEQLEWIVGCLLNKNVDRDIL